MADISRFAVYPLIRPPSSGDVSRLAIYPLIVGPPPAIPPDRDAGVWVEAWDLPNTTRRIATLPVLTDGVDIQQYRRPPGDGAIVIPSDYARFDAVFDPLGQEQPPTLVGSDAVSGDSSGDPDDIVDLSGIAWEPGDLLIVHTYVHGGTSTPPASLTQLGSSRVYHRFLQAGDSTWTMTQSGGNMHATGWSVWRGHDGQAPELVETVNNGGFWSRAYSTLDAAATRDFAVFIATLDATRGINMDAGNEHPLLYNEVVGTNFPVTTVGALIAAYIDDGSDSALNFTGTGFSTGYILAIGGSQGPSRSLLKVYVDGLYRYGFFPERITRPLGEDQPYATLTGRGQESQVSWAYLPPPAWNYGYDVDYFQNFTDPPDLLDNGGFYEPLEGAFADPTPGWSSFGGADHRPCSGCTTGTYGNVIKVTPGGVHKGISQTIGESDGLLPGGRYKLRTWIEGSVTGQRITISMDFGDAANSPTIHTTNGYTYKGDVYAELENVARNPLANGTPGGSTDGTVQYTELDVTIPSDCDSMTVRILSDMHSGAPGNQEFWVHGAALEGVGAGMPAEYDYEPGVYDPTQWDTGAATPISGDYSWRWTPEDTNLKRTLVGPITVEPGEYFARYAVRVPSFAAQVRLVVYGGDATTIFSDTGWIGSIDPGFPEYIDVAFTRSPASDQIYLGVLVQGVTTTYTFDEVGVFSGRPPSSPGQIISDMLAAVQALGFLTWLQTDFTATTDSNGELWRSTSIAADFGYGGTLKAALDRLATMGYEWIIEAENQRLGYDTGWVLRLFNGYQS